MKYQDEKGFTLILVIIVTTIILFIGTSMIKLTYENYKMKKLNSTSRKNFYIAEAGIEESYIILDKHIQESIDYSYRKITEYENKVDSSNIEIIKESSLEDIKNEMFIHLYKEHMKKVTYKLKDINEYNLNKIDGYIFYIDTSISEASGDSELILDIKISFDYEKVLESIRVKYIIKVPRYGDYNSVGELINKAEWINIKW